MDGYRWRSEPDDYVEVIDKRYIGCGVHYSWFTTSIIRSWQSVRSGKDGDNDLLLFSHRGHLVVTMNF